MRLSEATEEGLERLCERLVRVNTLEREADKREHLFGVRSICEELEEKEAEAFTEEEVFKIWDAYGDGDDFAGYLLVMIYSGMMPGELLACRNTMVDFDKCEIYGCGKKTKFRKKSVIVFADAVKPIIQILCENEKLACLDIWRYYGR